MRQPAVVASLGRLLLGIVLALAPTVPPAQAEAGNTQSATDALPEFDLSGFQSGFRCDVQIRYLRSPYLTEDGYRFYTIGVDSDIWTKGPIYLIAARSSARSCPLLFTSEQKTYPPSDVTLFTLRSVGPSPKLSAALSKVIGDDTAGCHAVFGIPTSLPQLTREAENRCAYRVQRRLNRKAFVIYEARVLKSATSVTGIVIEGQVFWENVK